MIYAGQLAEHPPPDPEEHDGLGQVLTHNLEFLAGLANQN